MQNFEDFLKNSSERDRNFQVEEEKWLKLEQELDQSGKKRVLFWWWSGIGISSFVLSWVFLFQANEDTLSAFKIPINSVEDKVEQKNAPRETEQEIESIQVREDVIQKRVNIKRTVLNTTSNKFIDETEADKVEADATISTPHVLNTIVEEVSSKPEISLEKEEGPYIVEEATETEISKPKNVDPKKERTQKRAKVYAYQEADYSLEVEQEAPEQGMSIEKIQPQKIPPSEWLKENKPKWMFRGNFALLGEKSRLFMTEYSTQPISNTIPIDYIRSSGEGLRIYPKETIEHPNRIFYKFYGISLSRYFKSGFGVKAGLIYNHSVLDNSSFAESFRDEPNAFYFTSKSIEQSLVAELGIQIRTKPWRRWIGFIGLSAFKTLGGKRELMQSAFQPGIQFEELEFSSVWKYGWNRGLFGLFAESSLQYRLTKEISLGPMYYIIMTPNTPSKIGYGFEVRYWW